MKINRIVFSLLVIASLLIIYFLDRSNRQWKAVQLSTSQAMLSRATSSGDLKAMQACLDAGASVNAVAPGADTYDVPLFIAAADHQEEAARYLLNHGANPNGGAGCSPLIFVRDGRGVRKEPARLPIAKLLLERGADPNARDRFGQTPLFYAKASEDTELALLLQQYDAHE